MEDSPFDPFFDQEFLHSQACAVGQMLYSSRGKAMGQRFTVGDMVEVVKGHKGEVGERGGETNFSNDLGYQQITKLFFEYLCAPRAAGNTVRNRKVPGIAGGFQKQKMQVACVPLNEKRAMCDDNGRSLFLFFFHFAVTSLPS